jgi:hypothetical protein
MFAFFLFVLFHGLGFTGASALFMFNVNVETGQILFIVAVVTLLSLLKRIPLTLPRGSWRLMPYSIGGIAAFWTIERVASIFVQTV